MAGNVWPLIASVAVMVCVLGAILFFSHNYTLDGIKSRTVGDGQHGTARWATKGEILKAFRHVAFRPALWRKGRELPTDAQGLILGSEGKKNAVTAMVDCDDVHCLMIGASGIGKRRYSEFLGFKMKVHKKAGKQVVVSHICDKRLKAERDKLVAQAKQIASPRHGKTELDEVRIYNAMVMGIQEYYKIATAVNLDCRYLHRAVMTVLTNRLKTQCGNRLVKSGRKLTQTERSRYGKSAMLRYVAGSNEPIYPIGYIQFRKPRSKPYKSCYYSVNGRIGLHENLQINVPLMLKLMRQPTFGYNAEYADNRISLFCAQWGKCAVTGREFRSPDEIHCHHRVPRGRGGGDEYANLILVLEPVHKLIHAQRTELVQYYFDLLKLDSTQLKTLNKLRILAGLSEITQL